MPVITEGLNLGDLLKYEAPNLYSRDQLTVAAGQNLVLGAVVGIDTLTEKVKALDPAATSVPSVAAGSSAFTFSVRVSMPMTAPSTRFWPAAMVS